MKRGYKLDLPKQWHYLEVQRKMLVEIDREDVPTLETVKVVLVHCNLVSKNDRQASNVSFTCVPNKKFGQSTIIALH